jgi:hypothetical protein
MFIDLNESGMLEASLLISERLTARSSTQFEADWARRVLHCSYEELASVALLWSLAWEAEISTFYYLS